jgi:hypothetical protein
VNALYDIDQQLLQLLLLPRDGRRVLAHLEARDGDAAGIPRRLAGRKQDLCALEYATPSRLVGMLASSATAMQPLLISVFAPSPLSLFSVVQGMARSHLTPHGRLPS